MARTGQREREAGHLFAGLAGAARMGVAGAPAARPPADSGDADEMRGLPRCLRAVALFCPAPRLDAVLSGSAPMPTAPLRRSSSPLPADSGAARGRPNQRNGIRSMSKAFSIKDALEAFWNKRRTLEGNITVEKADARERLHLEAPAARLRSEGSHASPPTPPGQSEPHVDARTSGTSGGQCTRRAHEARLPGAEPLAEPRAEAARECCEPWGSWQPAGAPWAQWRRGGRAAAGRRGLRERQRRAAGTTSSTDAARGSGAARKRLAGTGRRRGPSCSSASSDGARRGRSGSGDSASSGHRSAGVAAWRAVEAPVEPRPPREGKPEGAGGDSKASLSGWDVQPTAQTMMEEMEIYERAVCMRGSVKTREVYIRNLPHRLVTRDRLRLCLGTLFRELPAFQEIYPNVDDPITAITLHYNETGAYSFAELWDDTLASTAILFSGFEFCGKMAGIGRPLGYVSAPGGEAKPLDVTPLRQRGLLPMAPSGSMSCRHEGKLRELHFGNLVRGRKSPEFILNLVNPVAQQLVEWRAEEGPAVTNVNMSADGTYAFVQFQSLKLATKIMKILDGQEVLGRCLSVRRTNAFRKEEARIIPPELKTVEAVEALMAKMPDKVASTSHVVPFIKQLQRPWPSSAMSMSPVRGDPPSDTVASPPPGAPMQTAVAAPPPLPPSEATAQPASAPPQVSAAPLATASAHEATVAEPLAISPPTGAPRMAASAPPPPRAPEQPAAVVAPPSPRASPQPVTAASPATAPPTAASLQEVPEAQQPPREAPAQRALAPPQATRGFEEPASAVAVGATAATSAAALTPPATSEAPQNPDVLDGMPHGEPAAATAVEAASASPPLRTSLTAL
ncbi:unnamed protein product [Prorocentrum cordatum]|uniref:RRM domain-containing protein n=1 Tax=Prorocentrum cordatum TaxID=2364126 RepID=A0ABN9WUE6_9DINO|nr:unnamed protein product [Polarella glacialis]